MQSSRVLAACAGATLLAGAVAVAALAQSTTAPTSAPMVGASMPVAATPAPVKTMAPMPAGKLALDARALRARRTATGYTLTGQAQVNDACQTARFDIFRGTVFPPQFNATQFRRPDRMGFLCIQRLTWVTLTPREVRAMSGQKTVVVHTLRRPAVVVPIR